MIGSTNAYKNYFDEDEETDEYEYRYEKRKRRLIIISSILITISILFFVFSIVAYTVGVKNNPYRQYDLTERNDFNKDFNDPSIVWEYYP